MGTSINEFSFRVILSLILQAFNFSALSEEHMSMIQQLAKRDLQKEKENKELEKSAPPKTAGTAVRSRSKGRAATGYISKYNSNAGRCKTASRPSRTQVTIMLKFSA